MIITNLVIRQSGINKEWYYIDYNGDYHVEQIQKMLGVKEGAVEEVYKKYAVDYNKEYDVYFFASKEQAEKVARELQDFIKPSNNIRAVYLTEAEIEYIRKALINEDSNVIFTKAKIKESIFKKLNG